MSRIVALFYAVAGAALVVWAVVTRDYLPVGLLFLVGIVGLLHLTGPRGFGSRVDDAQIREQTKNRYGVNAPDRPRF